ncbi:MAG: ABC transporter substrate-binding protein [Acidimicrobiia bacterium]|nr:ABC transporter substrate-binding protein [Acidimicrobiia bacterium]
MRRSGIHRWLAALFALALLAGACGGDDGGTDEVGAGDTETDGDTGDAPVPEEGEGEPQPGGTLIVAATSDGDTLDPHASASFNVHNRVGLASSRLLKPDLSAEYEYGEAPLTGDLAEEWEVSDDLLTYTFHLRDDVVWHDMAPVNGRPFVADDVVATFERILDEGFQAYMLENVTSIEAPDEHTVVITLSQPFAPLLNYMGNHHMWIMPREGVEGEYDVSTQVIGTGPFMLTEWDRGVTTVYEKNPDYFEEGVPYLDGVEMPVVPDQGARTAAFRAGETHIITAVNPEETASLLAAVPDARHLQYIGTAPLIMYVNMEQEPFNDLRVRRAMSMAVDREGLGDALYGSGHYTGPVNAHVKAFALPEDELAELMPYDVEAAKQLLADAGYPDGFSTTLMTTAGYGPRIVNGAEWVVEDLAAIGIDAEIEVVDYATYIGQRWANVEYEMAVGLQTPFQEADEWLRAQHHSDGSRNWWNINDPELDTMLDEQAATVDEDERISLIQDIQRYIVEEVSNPMQLWIGDTEIILGPTVRNYLSQPQYGTNHYAYVWLEE